MLLTLITTTIYLMVLVNAWMKNEESWEEVAQKYYDYFFLVVVFTGALEITFNTTAINPAMIITGGFFFVSMIATLLKDKGPFKENDEGMHTLPEKIRISIHTLALGVAAIVITVYAVVQIIVDVVDLFH